MFEGTVRVGWTGDGLLANDTAVPRIGKFVEEQSRKQTVLIGSHHLDTRLPRVKEDNAGMVRIVAEHFMDRGYRHYAWFSKQRIGVDSARRDALAMALAANGHSCHFPEWGTGRSRKKDTWTNAKT